MTGYLQKARIAAAAAVAVAISLAAFAGGFAAAGGNTADIVTAQTSAPGPGAAAGPSGPSMGAIPGGGGPGMGGMGMGGPAMGMGMMGMGGARGGGGGGGGGEWPLGRPGAASAPIQDFQPGGAEWGTQPQWRELVDKYWVSLQWAREMNAKWNPVRREVLHYSLAAQGAAATVPESHWGLTHPMDFYLEGQRAQNRWAEAYVKAQWDLVPDEVKENLKQSARLAVMRKTRLMDEEGQKEQEGQAQGAGQAGMGVAPSGAAGAAGAAGAGAPAGGAAAPAPPPMGTPAPSVGALKLTDADIEAFNQRVAEEYEYLMRVYIMGYDSAPWFRQAYDPQDRSFSADGRPVLLDFTPPPYKARDTTGGGGAGGGRAAAPAGGPGRGAAGTMMGPMGAMGGRPGMGGMGGAPGKPMGLGAGAGSGPPAAPTTTGAASAGGGR